MIIASSEILEAVDGRTIDYIEELIDRSTLDEKHKTILRMELLEIGEDEANEMIQMLIANQNNERTRIRNGETLSEKEIRRAVKQAAV